MNITEYENFIERLFKGVNIPNLPFVVGLQEYTKDFQAAYMFLEDLKEYYKGHYEEIKERFKNNSDIDLPEIQQIDKVNLLGVLMDMDNQCYAVGVRLREEIFNVPMLGEKRDEQLSALLDTKEVNAIFKKAYNYGLIDKNKKWLKSKVLCAIFVKNMSDKLCLNDIVNSDGSKRVLWGPFERLFGFKKGSLRKSLYSKIYSDTIKGVADVNNIFKD